MISVCWLKNAATVIIATAKPVDILPLLTMSVPIPQLSTTRLVCCGA